MTDSPTSYREAVAPAIERLTRITCGFPQHINRDGVGTSIMRHDDVCALLGEVEALTRQNAILALREEQPSEGMAIVQAEYDHWIKEALKHKRPNGHRSDYAEADLKRALVAKRILDKLSASPVIKGGGLGASCTESEDAKPLPAGSEPSCPEEILADRNAVHLNMLRGGIAKLSPAQIGHLYRGEEAHEVIAELQRQNGIPSPAKPLSAEGEGSALASLNDAKRLSADIVTSCPVLDRDDVAEIITDACMSYVPHGVQDELQHWTAVGAYAADRILALAAPTVTPSPDGKGRA